jgi:GDP-L-fucose synthase
MKILITGGGGFIGRHLAEFLRRRRDLEVLAHGREELDLLDEACVDAYLREHPVDRIVHTANRGGGRNTLDMENVAEYNLRMFFHIAKHASPARRMIHLGSGAEYGKEHPIVLAREEEADRSLPRDSYGFYKAVCSRYIQRSEGIVNLRIFGCYGPYEDYRYKFITNAVVKSLLGMPITIHRNVRFDYLYIDDLLRMVEHFLFHPPRHRVYNASSGRPVELRELAELVRELCANPHPVRVLHPDMGPEYSGDNSRILSETGIAPLTPHREAVAALCRHFRSRLRQLDLETVREDPYLHRCDKIWKK